MTTETDGTSQGRARWGSRALIASLALNLLLVGALGSGAWHSRHGHRGSGPDGDGGLMGFVRHLPSDRQKILREDVEKARQEVRPLRRAVRDAWFDANTALSAEPFDREKYKAAVARLTEAETKFRTAIADQLADTASKLTPEERSRLQAWREKRRPHFFKRFGRHDGGRGDD